MKKINARVAGQSTAEDAFLILEQESPSEVLLKLARVDGSSINNTEVLRISASMDKGKLSIHRILNARRSKTIEEAFVIEEDGRVRVD